MEYLASTITLSVLANFATDLIRWSVDQPADLVVEAIQTTVKSFPKIEGVDETLRRWLRSASAKEAVDKYVKGESGLGDLQIATLASALVDKTDFYVAKQSHKVAKQILIKFFEDVRAVYLASPSGQLHIANRQEFLIEKVSGLERYLHERDQKLLQRRDGSSSKPLAVEMAPTLTLSAESPAMTDLITRKYHADLHFSVVHSQSLLDYSRRASYERIRLLVDARKRLPKEHRHPIRYRPEDFEERFVQVDHIYDLIRNGPSSFRILCQENFQRAERIHKYLRRKKIVICFECIHVACAASLWNFKKHYDIENLELDYRTTAGKYTMGRIRDGDEVDFVITANGAFFLGAHNSGMASQYAMISEIHGEEQRVLRRKGLAWDGRAHARVLTFADASPEEQFLIDNHLPRGAEPEFLNKYEEIPRRLDSLDPGEFAIVWQPYADLLARLPTVELTADCYKTWISLYCHQRWKSEELDGLREDLKILFLTEWDLCRAEPERGLKELIEDHAFRSKFAEALKTCAYS